MERHFSDYISHGLCTVWTCQLFTHDGGESHSLYKSSISSSVWCNSVVIKSSSTGGRTVFFFFKAFFARILKVRPFVFISSQILKFRDLYLRAVRLLFYVLFLFYGVDIFFFFLSPAVIRRFYHHQIYKSDVHIIFIVLGYFMPKPNSIFANV